MAGFMESLGRAFGMGTYKGQGDYKGKKPARLSETPWGQRVWSGKGGIEDAMGRIGTGYTPESMSAIRSPWAYAGQRQLEQGLAQAGQLSSRAGLGRSSVRGAQEQQTVADVSNWRAQQEAELQRQSQQAEIQQQMQGRGLGLGGAQADVASQHAQAAAEQNEFLRQQQYRQSADAAQQAGAMRGLQTAAGLAAGGMGALPGTTAGLGGALQGGLAGLGGDFGMFAPPATGSTVNVGLPLGVGAEGAEENVITINGKKYRLS